MSNGNQQELIQFGHKALIFARQMLGNLSDAEDLVQTSMVKALSHPSAPKEGVDLQKWIYRVVRNGAIDRLRERNRFQELDEQQELAEAVSPEQSLEQQQLKKTINQALIKLPFAQREIIVLRDYHQTSYEDIADILSIAKGTVMSRLHRARMALRQLIIAEQQSNNTNEVQDETL